MPSEQDSTALAAIIIAIIAFFVTTGQLLQQIFGTADGYRHCQASVIGEWATLTRRKWRWSEFRFETKFTTPNIRLIGMADRASVPNLRLITGDLESRRRTHMTSISKLDDDESGDQVGWLALLDQLHLLQTEYGTKGFIPAGYLPYEAIERPMQQTNCPAITLRERSWDLIPPDIIRPVATSTVGDIIALAHRLGMGWNDLRPGEGIMRAEGGGRSITSTAVRGFGVLLQFNYERAEYGVSYDGTIPSVPADKLGFGIIECGISERFEDIEFEGNNETEAAKKVMHMLNIDRAVISKYGEYMEKSGNSLGFSDILAMWAPFMTLPGSSIVRVMKVHRDVDRGPTRSHEGFVVFHLRLEKYKRERACSDQMLYLLSTYKRLKERWSLWERPRHGSKGIAPAAEFLSEIRKLWGEVMDSILDKYPFVPAVSIYQVLAAHITQAVEYPVLAEAALNDPAQRQKIEEGLEPSMDFGLAAGMHLYIDRIPLIVSFMRNKGFAKDRGVIDIWWTLIFRAMLWHRGHDIIEGKTRGYGGIPVPPSFWGSKLPVYIA